MFWDLVVEEVKMVVVVVDFSGEDEVEVKEMVG